MSKLIAVDALNSITENLEILWQIQPQESYRETEVLFQTEEKQKKSKTKSITRHTERSSKTDEIKNEYQIILVQMGEMTKRLLSLVEKGA